MFRVTRTELRRLRAMLGQAAQCSSKYRTPRPFVDVLIFYRAWAASMAPGASPLDDAVPWITFAATHALERTMKRGLRVFEYGTGGSTLFFARRVESVISVEHDPEWFASVSRRVIECRLTNWAGRLVLPLRNDRELPYAPSAPEHYTSSDPRYAGMSFRAYVEVIDAYPDGFFDIVLIDGRARPSCLKHAMRKVASGGIIVFDNVEREYYWQALSMARGWFHRRDYPGITPYANNFTNTTILKRNPSGTIADCSKAISHAHSSTTSGTSADRP